MNTGVTNVGVIAQRNYHSLMDHLGSGKEWDLHRKRDGLFILPPFLTRDNTGLYRGTVDAIRSVMGYVRRSAQRFDTRAAAEFQRTGRRTIQDVRGFIRQGTTGR